MDVHELTFPDESFDAVVALHVLDAVADQPRALAELHRVLRHGGVAVLQVPIDHQPQLAARLTETGFETRALSGADMGSVAVARHGLIAEERTYAGEQALTHAEAADHATSMVARVTQRCAAERTPELARLQPEEDAAVVTVDAHTRPAEHVGAQGASGRATCGVACACSGSADTLVGRAVGIRDRPARPVQCVLDRLARTPQLSVKGVVVKVRQAGVTK